MILAEYGQGGVIVAPKYRVLLRQMTAGDETQVLKLAEISAELHADWVSLPATPAAFRAQIERREGAEDEVGLLVWTVESAELAGFVTLTGMVRGPYQRGVLGFGAFAPSAGRGYMTEGLSLALRYAFGPIGLHRVEADVQPANDRSRRLLTRAGFRQEGFSPGFVRIGGRWRDHERWAVTVDTIGRLPPCDPFHLPDPRLVITANDA